MKLFNNNTYHSNFTPSPSSLSLKERIKAILPWNKNNKAGEIFQKKFTEKLTDSIVTNKYQNIKKATTLRKKFSTNEKISKIYENLLKEKTQLINTTLKSIRTQEEAEKALEIVNTKINNYTKNIDLLLQKPNLSASDKKGIQFGISAKTMMYTIRDQIEEKYLTSVNPNSSKKVSFNPKTKIRTFSANDTLRIVKNQKSGVPLTSAIKTPFIENKEILITRL